MARGKEVMELDGLIEARRDARVAGCTVMPG